MADDDETLVQKFWPADLHLVGKEIIRFHCVYWPAFLLAAGLPLPKAVTAHGWLLFEDSKMSKSKGNIVRTETILDAFGDEVYGKQFPESDKARAGFVRRRMCCGIFCCGRFRLGRMAALASMR